MKPDYDKAAIRIAKFILGIQGRFARLMNRISGQISIPSLRLILVFGCGIFIVINSYFITSAFNKEHNPKPIRFNRIHVVPLLISNPMPAQIISTADYNKLQRFRHYMDSLQTGKGKAIYDSIVIARAGLMDSIKKIENIYTGDKKLK